MLLPGFRTDVLGCIKGFDLFAMSSVTEGLGTRWHEMDAMRISISNWSTTEEDIDRSAKAILACARAEAEAGGKP